MVGNAKVRWNLPPGYPKEVPNLAGCDDREYLRDLLAAWIWESPMFAFDNADKRDAYKVADEYLAAIEAGKALYAIPE